METNDPTEYYEIVEINADDTLPIIIDHTGAGIIDSDIVQQTQVFPGRVKVIEANLAFWAVIDGVLLVFILSGNILTILAVRFSRRLRSVISNLFILSLAIADMVVGFTLPYHSAFYMGSGLGKSREWCLLRFFLIILACCVSIWNLIAIAVDRYIAIVYPLHYSRYMTKKVALILLSFGWILGVTFAMIPMFWNNWDTATQCEFDEVLPPWYMAGVITPGFSMVWVCMLIVYWRIWREASKHAKQLRSSFTGLHETPSDWKSVQVVLFILGCFSICWLPYFVIACAQIFHFLERSSPMLYKGAFSLAMANSGINPIIYAWKNSSFRKAFAQLLRCKSPDQIDHSQYSTRSNIHRKSSSLHHQDTINGTTANTPPQSALSGHFNLFDETSYHSGGVYDDEIHTPKVSHSRRVSLALTHSTIPSSSGSGGGGTGQGGASGGGSGYGYGQTIAILSGTNNATSIINQTSKTTNNVSTILAGNNDIVGGNGIINHKSKYSSIFGENGIIKNVSPKQGIISNGTSIISQHQHQNHQMNNSKNGSNGGNGDNGGKNIVIQQVECDGNGNTQIRILKQHKPKLKNSFINYHNHKNDFIDKINSLKNSKSCELNKFQQTNNSSTTTNDKNYQHHNVVIEQLSNGNHIVANMNNCDGRIV